MKYNIVVKLCMVNAIEGTVVCYFLLSFRLVIGVFSFTLPELL